MPRGNMQRKLTLLQGLRPKIGAFVQHVPRVQVVRASVLLLQVRLVKYFVDTVPVQLRRLARHSPCCSRSLIHGQGVYTHAHSFRHSDGRYVEQR